MTSSRANTRSQPTSSTSPAGGNYSTNHRFTIDQLRAIATELRRDTIDMIFEANSGHPGGSLSEMDILVALYFQVLRHDPSNPSWPDRDRFILSKGHACPGFYAVLAKCGYFPREELWKFRKIDSLLQGHAHPRTPGVEMNSGSLGQGLSFGVGSALAARLDSNKRRIYVLLGDGECDEGQVWEAAMAAAYYHLDNLTAVVDRNRIQNDKFTDQVMGLEPLASKWRAFGWRVLEVDGHDVQEVISVLGRASRTRGRPSLILAHTVKGKGVSFMENNPDFHGRAPNKDEYELAMKELV